MTMRWSIVFAGCLLVCVNLTYGQIAPFGSSNSVTQKDGYDPDRVCPKNWVQYSTSCYKFVRSPIKTREDARIACRTYNADLVSVGSMEEHAFIILHLQNIDPSHRIWYVGGKQQGNSWVNEGDNSPMINMDAAFLPNQEALPNLDYLAYSYSERAKAWGLTKVDGRDPLLYICEVPYSQASLLNVQDRTHSYGMPNMDPDKLPRGPQFILQPQPAVFDLTKRQLVDFVTLTCIAGGFPEPEYAWYKEDFENDVLVSTRIDPLKSPRHTISGGSLIINRPEEISDRGKYHCMARNKFGAIISESVQISFGFIGEFNLKRAPESGQEHWGKAIYCDPPQYFPDVQYYWARDYFPNFVEEDSRTFVSFDGNLYFSSLENIDKGRYSCNVQSKVSSMGRNGPFFSLDVRPHPNYQQLKFPTNFPKSFPEAPKVGDDVRLECVAFGYPVPKYNWTREGASIPRGAVFSNFNRVLTLPKVKLEDVGDYVCRATNDKISVKASVTVSVQATPIFTIPLGDMHMDEDEDLTWTCEAFGVPDVTYMWLKNGIPISINQLEAEDRERYEIRDNVLIVRKLKLRDEAMYQCRASNQLGARFSSGQLRVLRFAPSFRKKPLEPETFAAEGGNATLACNPEAAPRPTFTWKKRGYDGQFTNVALHSRRVLLPSGSLYINPVSREDEGEYMCEAKNSMGSDESSGKLIVLGGPRFVKQPSQNRYIAQLNESLFLDCEATADNILDLTYLWKHNGLTIRFDEIASNSLEPMRYKRARDSGRLEIHNITYFEAGEYECVAKTSVGRITVKTDLVVQGPPGIPGGMQVLDLTSTSARLRWTDGAQNGFPIIFYRIEGRTNWNQTWTLLVENITAREVDRSTSRKEAELKDVLKPWSTYEFRVAAANALGYGPYSAPSPQYSTRSDTLHRAPVNVGGGGGKTGDLTITWTPFPAAEQNASGIHYKVFWRRLAGEDEDSKDVTEETAFQSAAVTDTRQQGVVVKTVDRHRQYYYTPYSVKVMGCNDKGCGPASEPVKIYSAEDMPQIAPTEVAARAFNSTALNTTWLPMEHSRKKMRGKLIGYRVKYWREQDKEESALYYLSRSTQNWALIVGLMPDTFYWVRVMAYNAAGEGPQSERFRERTFKKAPIKPPTSVQVNADNPSTIKVVWRYVAPSTEEEPLQGYKIRVWEADQDMSTANDTLVPLGRKLEAYVTGLTFGKRYNLRVLAYSQGGDGKMSSPTWVFQMGEESDVAPARYGNGGQSSFTSCFVMIVLSVFTTWLATTF